MKRIILFFICIGILLTATACSGKSGSENTEQEHFLNLNSMNFDSNDYYEKYKKARTVDSFVVMDCDGGVRICRYIGKDSVVDIPEKIDDKKVVEIGSFPWVAVNDSILFTGAVCNNFVKTVRISQYVKYIDSTNFDGWYATDVENVEDASQKTALEEIIVDERNPYFSGKDGVLYNKMKTEIYCIPNYYAGNVIEISKNVKYVCCYCGYSGDTLKNVKGYKGSSAERFAKLHNLGFISLD